MTDPLVAELARLAKEVGAVGFGVVEAAPFHGELETVRAARASGRSGPLRFTYDEPESATDVTRSFPWAKSIAVVAWSYLPSTPGPADQGAVIGRFATEDRYQDVRRITSALAARLRAWGYTAEELVDDNRLVDRAPATRSGVGWVGRSTMTLVPGVGPWTLLGSVVTDAVLTPTAPMRRTCGTCTACLPACPTGALDEHGLDARKCLSTWLQTAGSIPQWIRPRLGRRIYGCDDCLVACPPGDRLLKRSSASGPEVPFAELLAMDDEALLHRFSWWYVPRRDGRYLRRNLLVAAGNSGEQAVRPALLAHLEHRSSLIRGHAAWAVARSLGMDAAGLLRRSLDSERAPETRDEIRLALLMVEDPAQHEAVLEADRWARTSPGVDSLALVWRTGKPERTGIELLVVGDVDAIPTNVPTTVIGPDCVDELAPTVAAMATVYDRGRRLDSLRRLITQAEMDQPCSASAVSSFLADSSTTGVTVTSSV